MTSYFKRGVHIQKIFLFVQVVGKRRSKMILIWVETRNLKLLSSQKDSWKLKRVSWNDSIVIIWQACWLLTGQNFVSHELNLFSKIKKTFVRPYLLQCAEISSDEVWLGIRIFCHLAFSSSLLHPTLTGDIILAVFSDTVLTRGLYPCPFTRG